MAKKDYGRTRSGKPITEKLLNKLAERAEEGFDVAAAASVESVRLDPELSQALHEQAEREGRTNSDLIRDALRRYLEAS